MFNSSDKSGKLKAVRTGGGHRRYRESDIDNVVKGMAGCTYGQLYEHLCSAQYIADMLEDENAPAILDIRERVGQKVLEQHNAYFAMSK